MGEGVESPLGFVVFFPIFKVFYFLEGAKLFSTVFAPSFSSKIPIKGKESDKSQGLYKEKC